MPLDEAQEKYLKDCADYEARVAKSDKLWKRSFWINNIANAIQFCAIMYGMFELHRFIHR